MENTHSYDLNQLEKSRRIHKTYFRELDRLFTQAIPGGMRVLEVGCHTGRLLGSVKPVYGLGVDIDPESIAAARELFRERPELEFRVGDVEKMDFSEFEPFDYIIVSDVIPLLEDVQTAFARLKAACHSSTRIILNFQNNLWFPLLRLASVLGLRTKYRSINWLSVQDVENILYLAGFEVITRGTRVLMPVSIPLITPFFNRFLAKLPVLQHLCLTCHLTVRKIPPNPVPDWESKYSVSIVIPTRNERGNIPDIFTRVPKMGKWTELIFVDGASTDGTVEAIEEGIAAHGSEWHRAVLLRQTGKGKGQAVRQAFKACRGDILMILDSDLTMPPEDLPKYYQAIATYKGDFINGSRLVYPMGKKAMRFLNMIANKMFAILFTWLLGQSLKDTLCGTKVLWNTDYRKIAINREFFGDFDPFGDFDLLFGAAKLNLKIVDLPIRYRDRTYGEIKISRWSHGWLLLKMCGIAFRKLKLN